MVAAGKLASGKARTTVGISSAFSTCIHAAWVVVMGGDLEEGMPGPENAVKDAAGLGGSRGVARPKAPVSVDIRQVGVVAN